MLASQAQLSEPKGRVLRTACTLSICDEGLRNTHIMYVANEPNWYDLRRTSSYLLYSKKKGLWEKIGDTPNFSRGGK